MKKQWARAHGDLYRGWMLHRIVCVYAHVCNVLLVVSGYSLGRLAALLLGTSGGSLAARAYFAGVCAPPRAAPSGLWESASAALGEV